MNSKPDETPGSILAKLVSERLKGNDTTKVKKELDAKTKKFFEDRGCHVSMPSDDERNAT